MAELLCNRDDSDTGMSGESIPIWTIDIIKSKALEMGKIFEPCVEIIDRLEQDLEEGAIVIFDEIDVAKAYMSELIEDKDLVDLMNLVGRNKQNEIAIIPSKIAKSRLPDKELDNLITWLISNNRC